MSDKIPAYVPPPPRTTPPEIYRAHLDYADLDVLVVIHDDGTKEIATRPGRDEHWVVWGSSRELLRVGADR